MAYVILKNDNGNLEALGPYLKEVSEDDYIMKHGVQIELQPYSKCDAVIDVNSLNDLLEAAKALYNLAHEDESRCWAWVDEIEILDKSIQTVERQAKPYFRENFTED